MACCTGENRVRFERALHRLRGFRFKRLLIVGSEAQILQGQYHPNIAPKAVLGTLSAFEVRYDLPVVFCETAAVAARQIEETKSATGGPVALCTGIVARSYFRNSVFRSSSEISPLMYRLM